MTFFIYSYVFHIFIQRMCDRLYWDVCLKLCTICNVCGDESYIKPLNGVLHMMAIYLSLERQTVTIIHRIHQTSRIHSISTNRVLVWLCANALYLYKVKHDETTYQRFEQRKQYFCCFCIFSHVLLLLSVNTNQK